MEQIRFVRVKVLLIIFLYLILAFQMMGAVINESEAFDMVRAREDLAEYIEIEKVPFGILISGTTKRSCLTCAVGITKHFFVTPFYTYLPVDDNLFHTLVDGSKYYYANVLDRYISHR